MYQDRIVLLLMNRLIELGWQMDRKVRSYRRFREEMVRFLFGVPFCGSGELSCVTASGGRMSEISAWGAFGR